MHVFVVGLLSMSVSVSTVHLNLLVLLLLVVVKNAISDALMDVAVYKWIGWMDLRVRYR